MMIVRMCYGSIFYLTADIFQQIFFKLLSKHDHASVFPVL